MPSLQLGGGARIDQDASIAYALARIEASYGVKVSVAGKLKELFKYGRTTTVSTNPTTVMTLPGSETEETYATGNDITHIVSEDTNDDQDIVIEGHTVDADGNLNFVIQTATLEGQGEVTLDTPLHRATRAYNNSSTDLVGPVYIYQTQSVITGVPQDDTKVNLIIPTGENQSQKASTSLSQYDYWIVTGFTGNVIQKAAVYADFRIKVKLKGNVFRQIGPSITVASGPGRDLNFSPYIIVPANADVILEATGSGAIDVSGSINGYLATVL